jgi:preprotein translocase subunit SecF
MVDFVRHRFWYFLLSLLIILPGTSSLAIPPAFRLGIEFTSGATMTIRFERPVEQEELRQAYAELGHGDAIIQRTGQGDFLVRTRTLAPPERDAAGNVVRPGERDRIEEALRERFGPLTVLDFASVSPIVAAGIVRNAMLAVAAASLGILVYIAWAFRHVPHPFRFGMCALVALLHDLLVVAGVFSIAGKVAGTEVDSMFIVALLTVAGYSVHDTIVVFDRIRENRLKYPAEGFDIIVNLSLAETLGRSLTTSVTVVLTLVVLLLYGGVTIREFIWALLIGVVSGTYSSIFNASQLLVAWEHGEVAGFFRNVGRALLTPPRLVLRLPSAFGGVLRRG